MQKEKIIEQYNMSESERCFTLRPLEHKGFNKHFVNLISADVFGSKKISLMSSLKNLFFNLK